MSVSLCKTLSSDSGTRDEDVVQVDTDMRGSPLEEAVHCPLKNGWN